MEEENDGRKPPVLKEHRRARPSVSEMYARLGKGMDSVEERAESKFLPSMYGFIVSRFLSKKPAAGTSAPLPAPVPVGEKGRDVHHMDESSFQNAVKQVSGMKDRLTEYHLISVIIFIIIFIGFFVWDYVERAPSQEPGPTYSFGTRLFSDEETGLSFEIPERWGEPRTSTHFSFTEAAKEITFSDEPNVRVLVATPFYLFDEWHRANAVYGGQATPAEFCGSYLQSARTADDERFSNGEDVFRQSGTYLSGSCGSVPVRMNVAIKKPKSEAQRRDFGWIPANDRRFVRTETDITHNAYFKLAGPVFTDVTVQVAVETIPSDAFCVARANISGFESATLKNYGCLNYSEKNEIDRALDAYGATRLGIEVRRLEASLASTEATGTHGMFAGKFNELVRWTSPDGRISFDFPVVMAAPSVDEGKREIWSPSDADRDFVVHMTTKADAEKDVRETTLCEGRGADAYAGIPGYRHLLSREDPCLEPWVDVALWQAESDLIAASGVGRVQCPKGEPLAADYAKSCEIAVVGGAKALVRHYAGHITDGNIEKEYVVYSAGTRYDIFVHSDAVATPDLAEYKAFERDDLALRTANAIARSVAFKQLGL